MFLKKISSVICSVVIAVTSLILPVSSEMRADEGMRNISTMQLVRDMGIGINLGNTYESCGDWISQWGNGTVESYETAWGVR